MASPNQDISSRQSSLEQFEIDPSQGVRFDLSYTKREYQISNIIFQDSSRDGILQFFNNSVDEQDTVPTQPTTETSTRPNRSSGGY
tara:strand:+ start:6836 stop:7093 length:258 start_codon:yes stop_codon:yes gene_type:complete